MAEKLSFQFMAMKAEASGSKSVKIIAYLCSFGLVTVLGICAIIAFL